MRDTFGTPIEVGDSIAYVTRRGSIVTIKKATVMAINDYYCWVESLSNRTYKNVKLQNGNNIVVMEY